MKKMLIGITALLLITIATLYYASVYIERQALQIDSTLNLLQKSVEQRDWSKAEVYLPGLYEQWQSAKATWSIFLDHTEIDSLDTSMHRVLKLVQLHDKIFALTEIDVTRGIVRHIPEIEKVDFKTIF